MSRVPAADGRFAQVAGMVMVYDESEAGVESMESLDAPSRVQTLIITRSNGTEDTLISDFAARGDPSRTFVLATNSFLLTGGDETMPALPLQLYWVRLIPENSRFLRTTL